MNSLRSFLIPCALMLCVPAASYAKGSGEQTQFGHDIRVAAGQTRNEVTCVNCSIHIAGAVAGEVTAIHGQIILEEGGSIGGDATAVWGDLRLRSGSTVGGDVVAIAGRVIRESQSNVGGDVTSLDSLAWLAAIILPPIFILGLIVALIIWLTQRRRRQQTPQPVTVYQRI